MILSDGVIFVASRTRFRSAQAGWAGKGVPQSSFDLDIHFYSLLVVATVGTLVDYILAEILAHVLGPVMLLNHMRSSHGPLLLVCSV